MREKLALEDQMTIEEFLAFVEQRPDGERWELIEGVAVMNAAPTAWHQVIAGNILRMLLERKDSADALWLPVLGVGTRVPISPKSLPQPDVYVQEGPALDSPVTGDALVIFEVLSRSNTKADQAWRKRVYASVPNCEHYVTLSARKAEVLRHDRANRWTGPGFKGLDSALDLPALGAVQLPLREIYRWTPLT